MSGKYAIALAACFALASAARADKIEANVIMSKADFDALRTRMIGQLNSDRYTEITPTDKASIIGALDRIDQRLAKAQLGEQDRVDIMNDQEMINQIATHASVESRMYCERDKPTGSNIIRVTCMSLAKWTERQKEGQAAWSRIAENHRNTCPSCMNDGDISGP